MSRSARKLVKATQAQARATQAMAAQNARVANAQAGWYQTQAQIAAAEAEARRLAALPLVCSHCRTANPPGSRACSNCGSLAFLPPQATPGSPKPPPSGPAKAWGWFRAKSTRFQVLSAVGVAVLLLVIAAAGSGSKKAPVTAPTAGAVTTVAESTTLAPAPPTTVAVAAPARPPHPGVCAAVKAPDVTTPAGVQRLATDVSLAGDPTLSALLATATANAAADHPIRFAYDLSEIQTAAC